jgi:hypothetical protein
MLSTGTPHFGQAAAFVLTVWPHSEQLMSAILSLDCQLPTPVNLSAQSTCADSARQTRLESLSVTALKPALAVSELRYSIHGRQPGPTSTSCLLSGFMVD